MVVSESGGRRPGRPSASSMLVALATLGCAEGRSASGGWSTSPASSGCWSAAFSASPRLLKSHEQGLGFRV